MDWRAFTWPFGEEHEDERLSALLDDELDTDAALEVTRHLADCERCLDEFESIRLARLALRGLPGIEPPPDLYTVLTRSVQDAGAGRSRVPRFVAAAATSAAVLGAAAFIAGSAEKPGTVSPPVDLFVVDHVTTANSGPMFTPVDFSR